MKSNEQPPQPWPETNWVEPDRLLAGEYPGARSDSEAARKLGLPFDAGIRTFIDLTEGHELEPFDAVLREEARRRGLAVDYWRMPIRDVSVPETRAQISEIPGLSMTLWPRIGRPTYTAGAVWAAAVWWSTATSCGGLDGEAALRRLRKLFTAMAKASWRRSPEQEEWVRAWGRE